MVQITIDPNSTIGRIKPLHGVGQPPFQGTNFSMLRYLTEAGIPYSRLHDTGGVYGLMRYVDIPNVFPNFDADENDPNSYNFAFTDTLITALVQANVEPFYRLGVTIENECAIQMFRLAPPKDFAKWARICEKVIRHYTQGWANGFHYAIQYWEIWNEPDNSPDIPENQMWWGTKEEYFALYDITAKHLKKCFPDLRIGGFASCGFYGALEKESAAMGACSPRNEYFLEFFDDFLRYIKEHKSPIDFFSWHSYGSIEDTVYYCRYARQKLDEAGYSHVEHMCNEWNCEPNERGTMRHAATTTGWMLAMQHTSLDKAMFYDARFGVSIYGGLFNPETALPYPAYYAFKLFNELYTRSYETAVTVQSDRQGVYAAAACKDNSLYVMIANTSNDPREMLLQCEGHRVTSAWLIGKNGLEALDTLPMTLPEYGVIGVALTKE